MSGAQYSHLMALVDEKYIRVTTFKKDGTEVSTPTWVVALEDGRIGFYTSSTSGKAKRLKNNPNVIVQPSDGHGERSRTRSHSRAVLTSSLVQSATPSTRGWSPSTGS